MKILIISPRWPWPLDSGGKVAQFGWVDYLRHRHEITLLTPVAHERTWAELDELQAKWPDVRCRPVARVARPAGPAPGEKSKPAPPLARLKSALRGVPAVRGAWAALAPRLRRALLGDEELLRSPLLGPLPADLLSAAAEESRQGGYDLIQTEYVDYLPLLHVLPAGAVKIFDHIELHYVTRARDRQTLLASAGGAEAALWGGVQADYVFAREKALELDTLARYNAVLTMSEHDRLTLLAELPSADIHASPFAYPEEAGDPAPPAADAAPLRDWVYVGGSDHGPNVDAVRWFAREVWPLVRRGAPGGRFRVVGAWSAAARQAAGADGVPGVEFTGFVDRVADAMREAVMVVPLRVGSGIRTKILMAMTLGVPVVSTAVGAEGIPAADGAHLLLADGPEDFARAALRAAADGALRGRLRVQAREFVRTHFSPEGTGARRDAIYREVVERARAARPPAPTSAIPPP